MYFSDFYCIYITIPHTKLFGNNHQRVFIVGESVDLYGGCGTKICFQVYHFSSQLCQPGCVYKDPTVWIDGARLPPKYICKYIKIKYAELHIKIYNLVAKLFSNGNCQIVFNWRSYSYEYHNEADYTERNSNISWFRSSLLLKMQYTQ
jgi:hypothetical protein